MTAKNGNGKTGWWVAGILASMLVTGFAAWLTFGAKTVKATDPMPGAWEQKVSSMIQTQSPYIKEQGLILEKLENIEEDVAEIKQDLKGQH